MNYPNMTCVIPSLANEQTYPYLKLTVESLRSSGFSGNIIVSTNGGRDKPNLSDIQGITVHAHNRTQGQCGAVNAAVQLMNMADKYVMVSNDDMYYAPDWDKNLKNYVNLDTDLFKYLCMSPNLVEPTNNAGSADPFLKCGAYYNIEDFDRETVDKYVKEGIKLKEKPEAGFNLPFIINAELWRSIQGYDTAYDPFSSNSDTCLQTRINIAGVTPVRLRDVLVYHFSNKSGTFDFSQPERQTLWQKNFDYFTDKYGFNRDTLPGCDVWYNKNMLPEDRSIMKFRPVWEDKYAPQENPEN